MRYSGVQELFRSRRVSQARATPLSRDTTQNWAILERPNHLNNIMTGRSVLTHGLRYHDLL